MQDSEDHKGRKEKEKKKKKKRKRNLIKERKKE
jgi:hypothetical protein